MNRVPPARQWLSPDFPLDKHESALYFHIDPSYSVWHYTPIEHTPPETTHTHTNQNLHLIGLKNIRL